jgi:3-hydroxybutyryl-CoA dehydratase
MSYIPNYSIEDLCEGQSTFFEITLSKSIIDAFVELSGDISPIHVNLDFAKGRGFPSTVAHGAIFCMLASRLVGIHLPGRNSILLGIDFRFHLPSYVDQSFRVKGTVGYISIGANAVDILIEIINTNTGFTHARGKATVSFTKKIY